MNQCGHCGELKVAIIVKHKYEVSFEHTYAYCKECYEKMHAGVKL